MTAAPIFYNIRSLAIPVHPSQTPLASAENFGPAFCVRECDSHGVPVGDAESYVASSALKDGSYRLDLLDGDTVRNLCVGLSREADSQGTLSVSNPSTCGEYVPQVRTSSRFPWETSRPQPITGSLRTASLLARAAPRASARWSITARPDGTLEVALKGGTQGAFTIGDRDIRSA